jgi:TPR repeat
MNAVSLSHLSRAQKTFSVSMALLGAVAAAQILAALYLYTRHPATVPINAKRKAVEERLFLAPKVAPRPSAGPVNVPAVAGVPSATVRRVETPPKSVPETLLRVAKGFRERGDTTNAIAKLQQATALDPGNAEILAELALTYESMQLFDRSNEVWRRLQSLGPAAGPLYELADVKLRVGVPAITSGTGTSGAPGASADESGGIPDGSTFGISEVSLKRLEDPEAQTKLLLRVGVKVRPGVEIDHTKVKIQVFFYDMVNNNQVVLTDADVSYEWVTPGHDWADTGNEVLDVTYLRPKGPASGSVPTAEVPDSVEKAKLAARKPEDAAEMLPTSESGPHEYLGYAVRVYYKEQLQAVRADPTRLLNLFPPPFTAAPQ